MVTASRCSPADFASLPCEPEVVRSGEYVRFFTTSPLVPSRSVPIFRVAEPRSIASCSLSLPRSGGRRLGRRPSETEWKRVSDEAYVQAQELTWERTIAPIEGALEDPDYTYLTPYMSSALGAGTGSAASADG